MSDFDRLRLEYKEGTPVLMDGNKMIGSIFNKKYIKQIRKKHLMTTPPAIAIDKDVFARNIQRDCLSIFIIELDEQVIYSTSVDNFILHSFYLNRGFGGQLALPMEYWGRNTGVVNQVTLPL